MKNVKTNQDILLVIIFMLLVRLLLMAEKLILKRVQ